MPETVNQRWAAQLIGALVASGVRHLVIAPGSRSTPLALAAADRAELSTWPVIDERVAGFFALGLSKGSGTPAAVVCTSGTAGAHLAPAVIEAFEGGTPLVVVTADRPWELHGFGAAQTIDQEHLFGRFLKAQLLLPAPDDAPALLAHLAASVGRALATAGRGPVHVNAPFREPLAPPTAAPGPVLDPAVTAWAPVTAVPRVDAVLPLLERARRGLIVCGPRERDDGFGAAVHRLGAHLGFPVLAEATSNARYGFGAAVAMYDAAWRSERAAATLAPDLILRFGGGLTARSMIGLGAPTTIHVSEGGQLFDPAHGAAHIVPGDAVATCVALRAARPAADGAWRSRWEEAEGRLRSALAGHQVLDEPAVAREVALAVPPGANLVLSSSMPVRDVDAFAPTSRGPLRVFSNRGVNGIDGVTSTALGIAAASGRPTTLLIGDLACLHDVGAWVTARQLRLPLAAVVVNNDGGGIFHFLPVADRTAHFERLFGTPHGVDLSHVAGLGGATLHRPGDLPALRAALGAATAGGLHLVEVRTGRQANVDAHRALFQRLAGALG